MMKKVLCLLLCGFLSACSFSSNQLSPEKVSESSEDERFSKYLSDLYTGTSLPICHQGLPEESCQMRSQGITKKEIWLQKEFFSQNGISPLFQDESLFTGQNADLFSLKHPESSAKLLKVPWAFTHYSFIAGILKVQWKFVLDQEPISILKECESSEMSECISSFPHISKLYFELSEGHTDDFPLGKRLEVWCRNRETSSLFMDYELVDLDKKTFQFFTTKANPELVEQIKSWLQDTSFQQTYYLRIAPNGQYAQEDLFCANRYFLNPLVEKK